MRPSQSAGHLALALLSLSTVSSAWPAWPRWLPELDSLVVRQDDSSSSSSTTQSAASSGPTRPSTSSTNLNVGGISKTATGAESETGTAKPTGTATKSTNGTRHTTFDPTNPVGSVVMTKPAATDGTQLYKIKDHVTFGWNYTNLLAAPTAIDVLASCSQVSATWTLTANMTFETQASYTWDTQKYQEEHPESPLPMAEYTLIIHDAESSVSATGEAGYLGTFTGLRFGLYTPKDYKPLGEWTCATCSAAMSEMERRGLGAVLVTCIVTVLSFTWFVTGFAGMAL